jgi:hypothetical protein
VGTVRQPEQIGEFERCSPGLLRHRACIQRSETGRFAELARVFRSDAANPANILASFQRFYFDTALSSGPTLPSLKAFAGSGRILFGISLVWTGNDALLPCNFRLYDRPVDG